MNTEEIKTEVVKQNYEYTFLFDVLEMLRGTCCIIHTDKELSNLFMAIINYLNLQIPVIDDEIIDFSIAVTVKK